MRRREFITTIGGAALAWPLGARAQGATAPKRVGFLLAVLSPESKEVQAFRRELRKAGYIEGRNLVMEWRSANGDYDRVPALVADLVRSNVDVIVQDSTIGTQVTNRATSTIPIVMALVLDPIGSGLVESLRHPGGNITGLSMMATELYPKRLELLKQINPQLARAAICWNPDHPSTPRQSKKSRQPRPPFQLN
jgi:putative tryptophan/tyrosine transport system substrate-binding protein